MLLLTGIWMEIGENMQDRCGTLSQLESVREEEEEEMRLMAQRRGGRPGLSSGIAGVP